MHKLQEDGQTIRSCEYTTMLLPDFVILSELLSSGGGGMYRLVSSEGHCNVITASGPGGNDRLDLRQLTIG